MSFPTRRLRRLRRSEKIRSMIQDARLTPNDLIYPIFVEEGLDKSRELESMPDLRRLSLGDLDDEVQQIADLNIPAVMLFGIPESKDEAGSSAFADNGIVQQAASRIKDNFGDKIVVMSDVCLCQYTSSGHCGIIKDGIIHNDSSIEILARTAASHAAAGVDVVSPSAMMDGQVAAIRRELDRTGFEDTIIMSHTAKHKSSFYSPFRDAAMCAPKIGDRKTYQVPFTNTRESLMEVESDIEEGVDIAMIKPALAYLDIIYEARRRYDIPISAYSVSGEYSLVKAAARQGFVDEDEIMLEMLHCIKRAGADIIVTYFAKQAARLLQ